MDDVLIIEIPSTPVEVVIPDGVPVCIEVGIQGVPGTPGVGIPLTDFRINVPLDGLVNGSNKLFTLPAGEHAIDVSANLGSATIALVVNGRHLSHGVGNDYTIVETGGPGTGFDAVVLDPLRPAPLPGDTLTANWILEP